MNESINEKALQIIDIMMDNLDTLACDYFELETGAKIMDCGIEATGSMEAGRFIAELCLGGMGAIRISDIHIDDLTLPCAVASTTSPKISTLGSQYAGWPIKIGRYFARASGPARALADTESNLFRNLDYRDKSNAGVIILETRQMPDETVTKYIAKHCSISESSLYCVVIPPASLAGSVQAAARILEVSMHKLYRLDFTLDKVRLAYGVAPIAPVTENDDFALELTNDCIFYGGSSYLFIAGEESDDFSTLIQRIPSPLSNQRGSPFHRLQDSFLYDFQKIDPNLFGPAEVTINDITNGKTFKAGSLNSKSLEASLRTYKRNPPL